MLRMEGAPFLEALRAAEIVLVGSDGSKIDDPDRAQVVENPAEEVVAPKKRRPATLVKAHPNWMLRGGTQSLVMYENSIVRRALQQAIDEQVITAPVTSAKATRVLGATSGLIGRTLHGAPYNLISMTQIDRPTGLADPDDHSRKKAQSHKWVSVLIRVCKEISMEHDSEQHGAANAGPSTSKRAMPRLTTPAPASKVAKLAPGTKGKPNAFQMLMKK